MGVVNTHVKVYGWMVSTDQSRALGAVVGENVRRLREAEGWTQQEAAGQLARLGLKFTRSQLASLESGRRADVETATLLLLAISFDVPVVELLAGSGRVRLSPAVSADLDSARAALVGDPVRIRLDDPALAESYFLSIGADADQRLADRLGLAVEAVMAAARKRWGRTLTEERDHRLAKTGSEGDRRAARGHVTRDLSNQLTTDLQIHPTSGGKA